MISGQFNPVRAPSACNSSTLHFANTCHLHIPQSWQSWLTASHAACIKERDDRRYSTLLTVSSNFKAGTELWVGSKLPDASIAYLQWVLCLVMKSSVIDGNEWESHLMATHRAYQCRNVKTANNFLDEPQYLIHMTKFLRLQDISFFSGILLTKCVRLFVRPYPDSTTDINIRDGWFLTSIILIWNALSFLVISLLLSKAQQPKLRLGRLNFEVSISHTIRHTHSTGLLRTGDQFIHTLSQNRTRDPSNHVAADLHLRSHGQWDRPFLFITHYNLYHQSLLYLYRARNKIT